MEFLNLEDKNLLIFIWESLDDKYYKAEFYYNLDAYCQAYLLGYMLAKLDEKEGL